MSAAEQRLEKKRIDAAVERVREVVHSASKNDIILALHNFDMDIARTIQAFCEDGAQTALDSWQQSGTSSKKKPQKKNKSLNVIPDVLVAPPSKPSELSRTITLRNGGGPNPVPVYEKKPMVNGYHNTPVETYADIEKHNVSSAIASEMSQLYCHGDQITQTSNNLETEISAGENAVTAAFIELRRLMDDRERHLLAELSRARNEGRRVLKDRRNRAKELLDRANRFDAMSEREQADLLGDIRSFVAEQRYEEDVGRATRLICDSDQLYHMIKNFGEVIPVKPFSAHKNSSHSSLVSSIGEDSGLGQISPVTSEEKKNKMVQVTGGGIRMHSDAFTADQLEDLNRRLHESLKAQGIDPSVLMGMGDAKIVPSRRRAPTGRATSRGGSRGGGGGDRMPPVARPMAAPELSIFENDG